MTDARVGIEIEGPDDDRIKLTDYLGHGSLGEV